MGADSKVEWTTHTFNPWRGCTKVSAGCKNCYAEVLSKRNTKTLGVWGPKGTRVVASEGMWKEPLKWDKAAFAAFDQSSIMDFPPERPRVFCASLADVFEDWPGPMVDHTGNRLQSTGGELPWENWCHNGEELTMQDVRIRLFNLIHKTPNLDWLLLTKRPERLRRSTRELVWNDTTWPEQLPNVWLGTSVEDQATASERIPHLLAARAKVRFLSVEPLLGPVDLSPWMPGYYTGGHVSHTVDWVIVGGESGPGARPCEVQWVESVVDQCRGAGVPVFVKQLGAVPTQVYANVGTSRTLPMADKKGGDMREWPVALRVRQFPTVEAS